MPTATQDQDFADELHAYSKIQKAALDHAIQWMRNNLDPDDVFDDIQLGEWATSNGYKKE
jgi:hypothetical protein